ncbi:mitochondrial small ribosomal subunit Rsm22-domain-containing protein [Gilbertella persicaria]|uniref:mitochondrial small ribosomal subunit Rsm22-domain-containing protein n=1 Tax=Gilbertella persicaria TaxID=101096 RepID=UPI00221E8492|nr:mitochondrial small ribosomal subunit Rsm22-domain-containing protein [Gilbertella persicaria]KAI8087978.1 mitochondrial small ribosomal subunit Rsm22-domain-containing protein [Gilbertella persicaria]
MAARQLSKRLLTTKRYYTTKPEKAIFMTQDQLESLGIVDLEDQSELLVKEINVSNEPYTRGSEEAEFGRKRIGCVQLPKSLVNGITDLIEGQDKRLIRTDALRLYDALRSTAKIPKPLETDFDGSRTAKKQRKQNNKKEAIEPHKLSYGPRESVAYAAGALPSTFAAITNVMQELALRLSDFKPKSMLDFGTGPGTAIWAAKQTFELEKYTGVDLSEDMLRIAEQLELSMRSSEHEQPIDFKRYLALDPKSSGTDLVVSAFTLGDIASTALMKSTVEQLWAQTKDVLVLIDRGTPIGFSNIARARQWILDAEKSNVHVVAPCSHDKPCPLLFSPQAKPDDIWCHFSQRVQRPAFLMKTKHSKFNTEDSKYAYVILRRGSRPSLTNTIQEQAYQWPRLIQPPLKKNGHVVMDVCSTQGEIQRMTIPKSQGKIPYRDARKAMWGDLFPHSSKNKIVTRVSQGVVDSLHE